MQSPPLSTLVHSSLDAIVCGDAQGRLILWNPAAEQLFGHAEKEALGQPFTLLLREQDRSRQLTLFRHFLRTGKSRLLGKSREVLARHKSGRVFPVKISLAVDKMDGEYLFTTIMHDISERKSQEKKLRQFHRIIACSSDAIALLDRQFIFRTANPAFLQACNKTADEVTGSTAAQVLGQQHFETIIKPHAERCLSGELVDVRHWFSFPDTVPRFIHVHYYPYYNDCGAIDGFVLSGRDITAWHRAKKSLSHKQTQLHTLLKASREINQTLDQTSIRKTLVITACQLLDCDSGTAGMVEAGCMVFREYLKGTDWIPLAYQFPPGYGVPGLVLQTQKPYLSDDAENDRHVVPEIRQALGFHHLIDVPILSRSGEILGCFEIHDRRDGLPFQTSDIELLQGLAASAAVALENTRLLGEQKQHVSTLQEKEKQLQKSLEGTIHAITQALQARDPYTAGHERRVAALARAIGEQLSLDQEQIQGIHLGALIHDIGKIQLPAEILSKPTRLTKLEYALIQDHARVGYEILKDIDFPWPLAKIAHQHHERLNGSGYPQGLKNDAICLEARIIAVADVVEAMASHRPYRPAVGIDPALAEIRRGRGQQYDSAAVDACLTLFADKLFHFEQANLTVD